MGSTMIPGQILKSELCRLGSFGDKGDSTPWTDQSVESLYLDISDRCDNVFRYLFPSSMHRGREERKPIIKDTARIGYRTKRISPKGGSQPSGFRIAGCRYEVTQSAWCLQAGLAGTAG